MTRSCFEGRLRLSAYFGLVAGVIVLAGVLLWGCGKPSTEIASNGVGRWQVQRLPTITDMESYTFKDDSHGWAVAHLAADADGPSHVLVTTDGGNHWAVCDGVVVDVAKHGTGFLPLRVAHLPVPGQVLSVDRSLFLIYYAKSPSMPPQPKGTFSSGILRSSDDGRTWNQILSLAPSDDSVVTLVASDQRHLWALCGSGRPGNTNSMYVLHSEDGGGHWRRVSTGGFGAFGVGLLCPAVLFVDERHAWSMARLPSDDDAFEVYFRTSATGGRTWKTISQPDALTSALVLFALDANRAWVGGSVGWPDCRAALLSTINGGKTWKQTHIDGERVAGVFFIDKTRGWVVATGSKGSTIYGTADGGLAWTRECFLEDQPSFQWVFVQAGSTLFVSNGNVMLKRSLSTATNP